MTIKKIGLSALVAATLTTGAFAASVLAFGTNIDSSTADKYNTEYLSMISVDVNDTNISFTSGFKFNANDFITIKIEGAKFLDKANYTMVDTNITDIVAEMFDDSVDGQIKFRVSENDKIVKNGTYTIVNTTNQTSPLQIAKSSNGDIKLTLVGEGSGSVISAAADDLIIFKKDTQKVEVKSLICNDGKNVAINTTTRQTFDPITSIDCNLTTKVPTSPFAVDFNYTDVNATVTFNGGNFIDGNFTADTQNGTTVTFVDIGNDNNNGTTYTLTSADDIIALSPTTFDANVKYQYGVGSHGDVTGYSLTEDKSEVMKWTLATYVARVMGMVNRSDVGTTSIVTVYNNSKDDTTIELKAINFIGADDVLITLTDNIIKAGERKTLITGRDIPAELNGYNLEITMDVKSDYGDVIGYQKSATGKVDLKVIDENTKNNGN